MSTKHIVRDAQANIDNALREKLVRKAESVLQSIARTESSLKQYREFLEKLDAGEDVPNILDPHEAGVGYTSIPYTITTTNSGGLR